MLTARTFLLRGLLAGLIAGIVTFGVAYVVGEPPVDAAIALEESAAPADEPGAVAAAPDDHAHDEGTPEHSHGEDAEVSRSTQSTWGLLTGTVLFGLAVGGILGLASAFALGRFGRAGVRGTVATVAAIGFGAAFLVPFLKYPANPPAVGDGETIGRRTGLFFAFLAVSVVAAVLATVLARRAAGTLGGFRAGALAVLGYLVVVVVAVRLFPVIDEVGDFPASLLWQFRTSSLAVELALWAVAAVVLGELMQRAVDRLPAPARLVAPEPVAA
ncbi:hypothetical protein GIS00_03805 [Nakamurella sp. YIM 132087]|uniref:CbtA family protein n=1 Tax=Nakamurella alba TaxID=2665158 RepID=A0A7K1FG33_9ACTN|nr:CbtA family protein [Nakamurella alba]MTD13071.1 hypothetical protein [Nakamurella alba]